MKLYTNGETNINFFPWYFIPAELNKKIRGEYLLEGVLPNSKNQKFIQSCMLKTPTLNNKDLQATT